MKPRAFESPAAQLASGRRLRTVSDIDLGDIPSDADAYEIQADALEAYGHDLEGFCVVGSSESVRHTLGLTKTVFSPVPGDGFASEGRPVCLPTGVIGAQCQLAFTFLRQFPGNEESATRQAVSTAVVTMRPAIGVLARRTRKAYRGDRPATADFAYHYLTILGKSAEVGRLTGLIDGVGSVFVDGTKLLSFPFPTVCEHPLDILCELASQLSVSKRQINTGDIVVVGAAPTILQVLPSQEMTFDLGRLGRVACVFG